MPGQDCSLPGSAIRPDYPAAIFFRIIDHDAIPGGRINNPIRGITIFFNLFRRNNDDIHCPAHSIQLHTDLCCNVTGLSDTFFITSRSISLCGPISPRAAEPNMMIRSGCATSTIRSMIVRKIFFGTFFLALCCLLSWHRSCRQDVPAFFCMILVVLFFLSTPVQRESGPVAQRPGRAPRQGCEGKEPHQRRVRAPCASSERVTECYACS